MYEASLALRALADLHSVPVTGRLVGRYMTALAGYPESAVVAAIVRSARECSRFPAPEAILSRLPRGATPPPVHDLPPDPPAPTAAERDEVRRLTADYLAGHDGGRKC